MSEIDQLMPLLAKSPFTESLTVSEATFMRDAVSAILEGEYFKALDELIAMSDGEIPDDCAKAYLTLARNLSAALENTESYIFFKKVLASYLLDNACHDEAVCELKELEAILPDDEDLTEFWKTSMFMDDANIWRQAYLDAFVLIKRGRLHDGFSLLAKIHRNEGDAEIESMLLEMMGTFYTPDREMLKEKYEKNKSALSEYPYCFGLKIPSFDELNILVFPVDPNRCFFFNRETSEFTEVEVDSERETKYFFKDLSKPLFVENETNGYNFRFLADNVRPSEDVAMDNHIYLYYEKPELLYCAMQTTDLSPHLLSGKFVFLIGEEERENYPIDFKTRFDVDYSSMPKREVEVNDIKRWVFQWTIQDASGHSFMAEIMDYHPNLITHPDTTLEQYHMLFALVFSNNIFECIDNFFDLPEDNYFRSEITKLVCIVDKWEGEQARTEITRYLDILKRVLSDISFFGISGYLRALLFAFSLYKGREFNGRIFPAFYYYPHMPRDRDVDIKEFYTSVCEDFPYCRALVLVRDPISVAGSWVNNHIKKHFSLKYSPTIVRINAQVFGWRSHFRDKDDIIYKTGVIVRFEDLKLNLQATTHAIVSYLNIPYSKTLESTTQNGIVCKQIFSSRKSYQDGLDITSVYAHIRDHAYLNEFDKYRIEMIVSEFYSYFGYAPKFYDGKKYTAAELERIMAEPWRFDILEIEKGLFTNEDIQFWRERTAHFWRNAIENPVPVGNNLAPMRVLEPIPELLNTELYR